MHFKNRRLAVMVMALGLGLSTVSAQEMSLKQCIEYGIKNNPNILKSDLEIEKTEQKGKEVLAGALPQVNATGTITDNVVLPTQILPGEVFGMPGQDIPVKFGTRYNVSGGIDASQVLYNQSLFTGIKAQKAAIDLAELNKAKTQEQLIFDIANAYYNTQITGTQKEIVQNNLDRVNQLVEITKAQYEGGIAKKTDYQRLLVNQTNLATEKENLDLNYQQQLDLLKLYMGMPLDTAIAVVSDADTEALAVNAAAAGNTNNNIDLQLIEKQKTLNYINVQQFKAGYLPTVSLFARSSYQAQQDNLDLFGPEANWFPNTSIGVSLNIPIFDGLAKHRRISQAKIQLQQTELDEKYLRSNVRFQNTNALNKLTIHQNAVSVQEENMKLAEEVYAITNTQYQGGVVPLTELLNAETSLKEAQTNYLKTLVQLKIAELELMKSSGNIQSIIK